MKVVWTDDALGDLENIATRAPHAAADIVKAVDWMSTRGFPQMFRRVAENSNLHVLSRPPYIVMYEVQGDAIEIQIIEDARQHREPW